MSELQFSGDIVVYLLGLAATWGTILTRIKQLEKKMELHNNAVERLTVLESKVAVDEEKISVTNNRIKDLEDCGK